MRKVGMTALPRTALARSTGEDSIYSSGDYFTLQAARTLSGHSREVIQPNLLKVISITKLSLAIILDRFEFKSRFAVAGKRKSLSQL